MMSKIEYINQHVEAESFSEQTLSKLLVVESVFENCQFENMRVKDVCFGAGSRRSRYINCSFDGTVFSSNAPGIARFENCSFKNIRVGKFFCIDIEMIGCVFSGEIDQGNFTGKHQRIDGSVSFNEFHDNDFSGLELGDVGFSCIDLKSQKLPPSNDFLVIYDLNSFLIKAKVEAGRIEDQQLKRSVLKVLHIIELESEGGNNQIFLDKRSFPKNLKEAVLTVFSYYGE